MSYELLEAIESENINKVKASLAACPLHNQYPTPPLILAAAKGNLEIVSELLKAYPDVNVQDPSNYSALMRAVQHGHFEIVQALLEAKANVDLQCRPFGNSALILAVKNGDLKMVQALLAAQANPALEVSLLGGTRVTALMIAATDGHLEIVHALLKAGCDVNQKTLSAGSALTRAASNGHLQVVQALINAGAAHTKVHANGIISEPLSLAIRKKHYRVASFLHHIKISENPKFAFWSTSMLSEETQREFEVIKLEQIKAFKTAALILNKVGLPGELIISILSSNDFWAIPQATKEELNTLSWVPNAQSC